MAKKPHLHARRRATIVSPRDGPGAPAVQSPPREAPASGSRATPTAICAALAALAAAAVGLRFAGVSAVQHALNAATEVTADAGEAASPGPGLIEVREVWLHPPEDRIRPGDCDEIHAAWGTPDRGRFVSAMVRAGLDGATRAAVLDVTSCDANGCVASPPDAVLAGLSPPERVRLLRAMRDYPQAQSLNGPFTRPASRRAFCDEPGLSDAAREVLRAGSFVDGATRYFSDLTWLCHRVTDPRERAAYFRVLRARSAFDATVRVRSTGELARAVAWWGVRGREDVVRARLLASMRGGDAGVPLRDLLPPFARARYGTFPPPRSRENCFWTALNFFSPTGEGGALIDSDGFDALVAGWTQVPLDQLRFGDVLVFRTEAGATEHAAVYIAEDLVFTKDGASSHRGWELGRLSLEARAYGHAPSITARRPRG